MAAARSRKRVYAFSEEFLSRLLVGGTKIHVVSGHAEYFLL